MTISISKFFPATVLTTSAATIYTIPLVPSTTVLKNGRVALTNTTAGPVTATLYSTTAASAAVCFLFEKSIAVNETLYADLPTMGAGDALVGKAGANTSITVHECGGALYS